MKLLKNDLVVFIFLTVASVFFFACSDELIAGLGTPEHLPTNASIGTVGAISVGTGFTDSLFAGAIAMSEPSLRPTDPNYLDNTLTRAQKYVLAWSHAQNAAEYEVRVLSEPITETNWALAQTVSHTVTSDDGVTVVAEIPLSPRPQVLPARCVNCGECVKKCPVDAITTSNGRATIDYDKCIECGQCFQACAYKAIEGFFAGVPYYFAVRAKNSVGEYGESFTVTPQPFLLRYATHADIPDSSKPLIPVADAPWKGCMGNCNITFDSISGCANAGCFITSPLASLFPNDTSENRSVCPVDAVYSIGFDSATIEDNNTAGGAIFIDKDKCINCGRCVVQCYQDGGFGAVTTEVIASVKGLFSGE